MKRGLSTRKGCGLGQDRSPETKFAPTNELLVQGLIPKTLELLEAWMEQYSSTAKALTQQQSGQGDASTTEADEAEASKLREALTVGVGVGVGCEEVLVGLPRGGVVGDQARGRTEGWLAPTSSLLSGCRLGVPRVALWVSYFSFGYLSLFGPAELA